MGIFPWCPLNPSWISSCCPKSFPLLLYFLIPNSIPNKIQGRPAGRSCPCLWEIPELLRSFSLDFEIFPNRFVLRPLRREKTTPGKRNSQEFSTGIRFFFTISSLPWGFFAPEGGKFQSNAPKICPENRDWERKRNFGWDASPLCCSETPPRCPDTEPGDGEGDKDELDPKSWFCTPVWASQEQNSN